MRCEHCGTENAEGNRFCSNCGEPLAVRCASCGETVPAGSKFCPTCGARVAAAATAPSTAAPASQPFGAPPPPAAAPTYGPSSGARYYTPSTPYGQAAPYPSAMPPAPSAPPPPSYGGIRSAPATGASTVSWAGGPSATIPPYAQPLPVYKGVWPRFFAMLLDGVILGVPLSILMMVVFRDQMEAMAYGNTGAMMGPYMLMMLISLAYSLLLEANGGTLGKTILGMKIVDAQGNKPGLGKSIVRNLLRIVDAIPGFYLVGVIAVASSATKQRIGDKVAGTYVVAK